ncbi:uncharacterized protein LOC143842409 isoform X3 [Paroedura picta]|uniref:uncharacterized protein LOC143842409 isoform X3 n=1 Tax=Paroedura picta TaxID=143630 RepID=UPI00405776AC
MEEKLILGVHTGLLTLPLVHFTTRTTKLQLSELTTSSVPTALQPFRNDLSLRVHTRNLKTDISSNNNNKYGNTESAEECMDQLCTGWNSQDGGDRASGKVPSSVLRAGVCCPSWPRPVAGDA